MKFPIGELLDANAALHNRSNLGQLGVRGVGKPDTPVDLEISVTDRRASGFRIAGTVNTALTLPCDRCLKAKIVRLSTNFNCWVALEDAPEYDDDAIRLAPGDNKVALNGLVGEAILLAVPSKIVCRENCAGLCPHCGQDLNIEQCGCQRDELDPRWADLLKIKAKFKK